VANLRGRRYLAAVAGLHGLGLTLLLWVLPDHPGLAAMGVLAYTLGLRHAFDPDHLAAIDNTVRRFIQAKTPSHGTGFWFSLGHSSVVFLMAFALAFGGVWVAQAWPQWKVWGAVIGPTVSGAFLLVIGLVNLALWWQVWTTFQRLRRGEPMADSSAPGPQGPFVRLLRPLFRLVTKSWHLYPLGFLFGLGFDTASEITLLALSTQGASQSLPWLGILSLPLLFAAGMSLLDTVDGLFMTKAYGWSLVSPLKKVYYNLSVTGLSVFVAVAIGAVELAQVAGWGPAAAVNFGDLGFFLAATFVVAWLVSVGVWKLLKLEQRRT
jgi:high-affinity nickel-transport protein